MASEASSESGDGAAASGVAQLERSGEAPQPGTGRETSCGEETYRPVARPGAGTAPPAQIHGSRAKRAHGARSGGQGAQPLRAVASHGSTGGYPSRSRQVDGSGAGHGRDSAAGRGKV